MATCYFTFYKDITLTKIAHFSKRHYHLSFCGVKVSGDSVARYSQVCSSAMLLLLMQEVKMYGIGVSLCGITFIQSFVKLCQLVQKFKMVYPARWSHKLPFFAFQEGKQPINLTDCVTHMVEVPCVIFMEPYCWTQNCVDLHVYLCISIFLSLVYPEMNSTLLKPK